MSIKEDLINGLAENLTYKDIIRAEEYSNGYAEGFKDGLEAGKQQKWIPCSERLPNEGDRIVVQYANGDSGVINSCRMRLWNIINSPYATVVAWMPLPKPWEGADNE